MKTISLHLLKGKKIDITFGSEEDEASIIEFMQFFEKTLKDSVQLQNTTVWLLENRPEVFNNGLSDALK
jgi:hypothetical protein